MRCWPRQGLLHSPRAYRDRFTARSTSTCDAKSLQATETNEKRHERNGAQHASRGMKPAPPSQKFSRSFALRIEVWIE